MNRILAASEQSKLVQMVALGMFLFIGIAVFEGSLLLAVAILTLNIALGVEDHFRQKRKRNENLSETAGLRT